jgi:hypothetical protein
VHRFCVFVFLRSRIVFRELGSGLIRFSHQSPLRILLPEGSSICFCQLRFPSVKLLKPGPVLPATRCCSSRCPWSDFSFSFLLMRFSCRSIFPAREARALSLPRVALPFFPAASLGFCSDPVVSRAGSRQRDLCVPMFLVVLHVLFFSMQKAKTWFFSELCFTFRLCAVEFVELLCWFYRSHT